MKTDIRSVDERLSQDKPADVSGAHELIKTGMRALAGRLYDAFPVKPDPLAAPFAEYSSPNGAMRGSTHAYTSEELDWVIDAFIASPQGGFCNHHLTVWLPPSVKVPHLGLAIGTIPQLFFYCDLVPRANLAVDLEQLDRYHGTFNDRFMEITADARFTPFVSKEIYVRTSLSPVAICVSGEVNEANIARVLEIAEGTLTQWIEWVKAAPPVPEAERPALAARDRFVRRTICERDPANIVAERVLGAEMTQKLVHLLAGLGRSER